MKRPFFCSIGLSIVSAFIAVVALICWAQMAYQVRYLRAELSRLTKIFPEPLVEETRVQQVMNLNGFTFLTERKLNGQDALHEFHIRFPKGNKGNAEQPGIDGGVVQPAIMFSNLATDEIETKTYRSGPGGKPVMTKQVALRVQETDQGPFSDHDELVLPIKNEVGRLRFSSPNGIYLVPSNPVSSESHAQQLSIGFPYNENATGLNTNQTASSDTVVSEISKDQLADWKLTNGSHVVFQAWKERAEGSPDIRKNLAIIGVAKEFNPTPDEQGNIKTYSKRMPDLGVSRDTIKTE